MTVTAQAWRYFRRYGGARTLGTIVRRYIWCHEEWVIVKSLLAGPPAADRVGEVVFRLAAPSDLRGLEQLDSYRGPEYGRAVKQGDDWVFVAGHAGRIIAARRYSRTVAPHSAVARVVHLRPDQLYGVDAFCLPEYRSQGIIRLLGVFAMRHFASLGYTENYGVIGRRNKPSLAMSRHKGSEPVCFVSLRRILFWERLVVSHDLPADLGADDWRDRARSRSVQG